MPLALQAQSHPPVPYATVNPHAFLPAIAPHLAAREAGVSVTLETLAASVRGGLNLGRELTLVEGAGRLAGAAERPRGPRPAWPWH